MVAIRIFSTKTDRKGLLDINTKLLRLGDALLNNIYGFKKYLLSMENKHKMELEINLIVCRPRAAPMGSV